MTHRRVAAVRAARVRPEILAMIEDGRLSLCVAATLAPHLTTENAEDLVALVAGHSRREVECLLAARSFTKAPARDIMKPVATEPVVAKPVVAEPSPFAGGGEKRGSSSTPEVRPAEPVVDRPAVKESVAHRIHFMASARTVANLRRLEELRPGLGLDALIEEATELLLERLAPERRDARRVERKQRTEAKAKPPADEPGKNTAAEPPVTAPKAPEGHPANVGSASRYIGRALRDAILVRDGLGCTFTAPDGTRCGARTFPQIDHDMPFALAGSSDDPNNLAVLCSQHNALRARRMFPSRTG
jgi:hypothetical protein